MPHHLIDYLFEIGPAATGGMGGPVSLEELESWQRLCGHSLKPWIGVPTEEKRQAVAKHIRNVLRD